MGFGWARTFSATARPAAWVSWWYTGADLLGAPPGDFDLEVLLTGGTFASCPIPEVVRLGRTLNQ